MPIDSTDKLYTFEKKYPITMAEHDLQYRLKPAALLNLMQDTAASHIEGTKLGNHELNSQNLGWFLIRYRIEFDVYPQELQNIIVQTEFRGFIKRASYRDFEVFNSKGERLLRASSSWLMGDLKSKSLINLEQKFPEFKKFEKRKDDLVLQKLNSFENFDNSVNFHVRYDDLDMNGHVNNTVYITWALEALDFEFRNTHTIKTIDIYYKHEVKYGEEVQSVVKYNNDFTQHIIKNVATNEDVCLMNLQWINL